MKSSYELIIIGAGPAGWRRHSMEPGPILQRSSSKRWRQAQTLLIDHWRTIQHPRARLRL